MIVPTPKTANEYLDLIDQAIFEMDDVLACADEEVEDMQLSELVPLYEYLVKELKQLHADLVAGKSGFGQGDNLPMAEVVAKWGPRIPCVDILNIVITGYREGLK